MCVYLLQYVFRHLASCALAVDTQRDHLYTFVQASRSKEGFFAVGPVRGTFETLWNLIEEQSVRAAFPSPSQLISGICTLCHQQLALGTISFGAINGHMLHCKPLVNLRKRLMLLQLTSSARFVSIINSMLYSLRSSLPTLESVPFRQYAKNTYFNSQWALYVRSSTLSPHLNRHPLARLVRVGVTAPRHYNERRRNYYTHNFPPAEEFYPVLEGDKDAILTTEGIVITLCKLSIICVVAVLVLFSGHHLLTENYLSSPAILQSHTIDYLSSCVNAYIRGVLPILAFINKVSPPPPLLPLDDYTLRQIHAARTAIAGRAAIQEAITTRRHVKQALDSVVSLPTDDTTPILSTRPEPPLRQTKLTAFFKS